MGNFWTCKLLFEDSRIHLADVQSVCVCVFPDTGKYQIEYLAQTGKVKYLMLDSILERVLRKTRFLIRLEIIRNNSSTSQQPA